MHENILFEFNVFFLCFSELKKMKSNMFSLFTLFKKG